jgi:hypothetical protein
MTTCKMCQAVQTRSGRTEPVLSRGGGGGSRQIPTQTTLEVHSDNCFTDDSKNHPSAHPADYTNVFTARSSARKAAINTCHAAPDSLFPHEVML